MRRKPATDQTFIDHCRYQVLSLTNGELPQNWQQLARTFTTFANLDTARQTAQARSLLNDGKKFGVVDRDTAEIVYTFEAAQ